MSTIRALIEARIKAQVTDFKEVRGAADLSNVLQNRVAAPACYVFQESDQPSKNNLVNAVSQRVVDQLAVVIVVRNVRDPRGSDAADVSEALRDWVRAALVGWIPASTHEQIEYAGSRLISFADGFFITKDSYRTAHFVRAT